MKKRSHKKGAGASSAVDTESHASHTSNQEVIEKDAGTAPIDTPKSPHPLTRRRFWVGSVALVCSLIILWIVGNLFFTRIQLGNTYMSGRTTNYSLEQALAGRTATYRLAVSYPDATVKLFTLPEIGIQPLSTTAVQTLRQEQNSLRNRLMWWRPVTLRVATKADQPKLTTFISQHITAVAQPAQPATISIAEGKVVLQNAVPGKKYSVTNPALAITTAIRSFQVAPIQVRSLPLDSTVTTESLAPTKATLEAILEQPVAVAIGEITVTPTPLDIANWLDITQATETKAASVTINNGRVTAYITNLARTHSKTARAQVTHNGAILTAGQNGVSVSGVPAAVSAVTAELLDHKGLRLSLPVQYIAFKTVNGPSANRWIEVNTTTKHLYAYDNGELVREFLVSAGAPATPTVTGTFTISTKYTAQNMFGPNTDGSTYYQANVPWVSYFYGGYAIHGNYWRPASYFGNINSSHGCVGLQVGDAEWLYYWAPVGTQVLVHT